jgi:hypothetical protein
MKILDVRRCAPEHGSVQSSPVKICVTDLADSALIPLDTQGVVTSQIRPSIVEQVKPPSNFELCLVKIPSGYKLGLIFEDVANPGMDFLLPTGAFGDYKGRQDRRSRLRDRSVGAPLPLLLFNSVEIQERSLRRQGRSDGAARRVSAWRALDCWHSSRLPSPGQPEFAFPAQGASGLRGSNGRTRS